MSYPSVKKRKTLKNTIQKTLTGMTFQSLDILQEQLSQGNWDAAKLVLSGQMVKTRVESVPLVLPPTKTAEELVEAIMAGMADGSISPTLAETALNVLLKKKVLAGEAGGDNDKFTFNVNMG